MWLSRRFAMEIKTPFKFRVQIVTQQSKSVIIKDRRCFVNKQQAIAYYNEKASELLAEEILYFSSRKKATDKFQEVERYEIGEEKRVLEA